MMMLALPGLPESSLAARTDIADLVVAADGSGNFLKVQAAIDTILRNHSSRTVIFIKPGIYKEKIRVPSDRKNLSLVGESYETTILTFDDYGGKTSDYANARIPADDFSAQNLTFQNTIDRTLHSLCPPNTAKGKPFMSSAKSQTLAYQH